MVWVLLEMPCLGLPEYWVMFLITLQERMMTSFKNDIIMRSCHIVKE